MSNSDMGETRKPWAKPELARKGVATYGELARMDPDRKNADIQAQLAQREKDAAKLGLDTVFQRMAVDTYHNTSQKPADVAAELEKRARDTGLGTLARRTAHDLAQRDFTDPDTVVAITHFNNGWLDSYLEARLQQTAAEVRGKRGVQVIKDMQASLEAVGRDQESEKPKGMTAEEAAQRIAEAQQRQKQGGQEAKPGEDADDKEFSEFRTKWEEIILNRNHVPADADEETKARIIHRAYQQYLAHEAQKDEAGKKDPRGGNVLNTVAKLVALGLGTAQIIEELSEAGVPVGMVSKAIKWAKARMWGEKPKEKSTAQARPADEVAAMVAATVAEFRRQEEEARKKAEGGDGGTKGPNGPKTTEVPPPPKGPPPPSGEGEARPESESFDARWTGVYATLRNYTGLSETYLAKSDEYQRAVVARNQLVAEAKGQGVFAPMKTEIGDMFDKALLDYENWRDNLRPAGMPGNDPLATLVGEIERRRRGFVAAGGNYGAAANEWVNGVLRHVEQVRLETKAGVDKLLGRSTKADELAERRINWEIDHLNWGDIKDQTLSRLTRLNIAYGEWVSNYGPDAAAINALRSGTGGRESGLESLFANQPPQQFVSLFREGRYGLNEKAWKDKVDFVSVRIDSDRNKWALKNMGAFNNGVIPAPDRNWKEVVDTWLRDMQDAAMLGKLDNGELKRVAETRKDLLAMMAVSASARAMEQSGGAISTYVATLTQDPKGDLDTQDKWAEWLLHKDPEKYRRLISNPLVERYYKRLCEEAGLDIPEGRDTGDKGVGVCNFGTDVKDIKVDVAKARGSKLVDYLRWDRKEGNYKGGFNAYVDDVLLTGDTEEERREDEAGKVDRATRWSAAKLACDAFLVDKLTRWDYEMSKVRPGEPGYVEGERTLSDGRGDYQLHDDRQLRPFEGWGGDPLRAVLEPSFLPRRIKGVYAGADRAVLDMFDMAFRPDDIFNKQQRLYESRAIKKPVEPIPASMVGHLKNLARWGTAHWTALGGSRGPGLPLWTKDTLGKDLGIVADMLDQVYGGAGDIEEVRIENQTVQVKEGKYVVGAMIARLLQAKALATAQETMRPGGWERLNQIFGSDKTPGARPFAEVMQALWGDNLKAQSGWLVNRAGARERIRFVDRPGGLNYGTEKALSNTWDILASNDQDPRGQRVAKAVGVARAGVGILTAAAETWGKKR